MRTEPFESQHVWICTLALVCAALSAGCFSPPTAVDPASSERLITIGGPITETVFALGRGATVVAVDTSSIFPAEAVQRPKVGYQRTIAAEGILALRPTRILAAEETGPPAAVEQLRASGVPLTIIPSDNSLAGARSKITTLAQLLGVPERGAQLIARLDAEAAAATAFPVGAPPRVLFVYARASGAMQVAGADTSADAMIRLAGGENAAAALRGYKPWSAESLLSARPQVLLFTSRGAESLGGPQAILQLPGVSALPAEQRPRVITQDDLLLLGFGPRTGQAIAELRAKLAGAVVPTVRATASAAAVPR